MILAASILSADFGHLHEEIEAAARGGAEIVHIDVMDGHFVPNLSVGPPVIRALRRLTQLRIDVHLMIDNATGTLLDAFVDAGADWVSVHVEVQPHLQRTVDHLRSRGVRPGVVLNPATPVSALDAILPDVDYVLVMTVNPGFGGQKLLPRTLDKVRALRAQILAHGLRTQIEADGGIDDNNVSQVLDAGVDIIVAGESVFGSGDAAACARRLLTIGKNRG
jgi:ribulose-phosphate 3-epimerase